ncbi:aldehyde dehydrogenase family protein, partial [Litorivivens sp.]|uniref:aldehyde dehydrogenase family protein n=1 Tax=Litorivivens sp. TaxID=2020868 RepID=UPI003568FD2A
CGFGLTLGVHSRIQGAADRIARRAQVGNVYVNRDMIGAVVGVQPFGGRGLSGTGPKAGGPHYLKRLVRCNASTDLDWAEFLATGREQLAAIALPGPTGESNTLHLEPRGRLVALFDEQDCAEQACAAISTAMVAGNRLDVHAPAALVEHLQKTLPESALKACSLKPEVKEEQLSAVLLDAKVQGVLTLPSHPLNSTIARTLAQRQGALACFICEEPGRFYLQRFVLEKTVTINTTAAGGNASLMTLTEGDPIRAAVEAV